MEDSFEIASFIDQGDMDILMKFYATLPKTYNKGDDIKAYTTGFPIETIPIKNFLPKLREVFGDFNVTVSMFLEEFVPWNVHSDYHKEDSNPYYAILIPLDYEDKNTHTIIFNEIAIDVDWKKKLQEEKNYQYTENENKLLSHIDKKLLSKLSIDKVCKWKKGKLIAWHRKLAHTSDNFLQDGIKRKIALVLFLNEKV